MQDHLSKPKADLRRFRKDRGLTLEAVGFLGDVDPATVSRIERGLVQPERETIVKLAKALGISVSRMRSLIGAS